MDLTRPGHRIDTTIRFVKDGGVQRGIERATYSFNADRSVTFSARSESFDPAVVRDVVYLLGPDYRPRSCFVQVTVGGRPAGAGWYRFADHAVMLAGDRGGERIDQRFPLATPVKALVSHPVSADVLVGMAADKSRPHQVLAAEGVYLTLSDPYGRTGPDLVAADVALDYRGVEQVETPIGRLPADHYLLHLPAPGKAYQPFQDLWCLAGTGIFLGAYARPPIATRYELVGLEHSPAHPAPRSRRVADATTSHWTRSPRCRMEAAGRLSSAGRAIAL